MYNVAIVILNYLNYEDTVECVNSILEMQYDISGIVVVDNASDNGSYGFIKKAFKQNKEIHVIKSHKNLGYARGNNLGITYARQKLCAEFVLVVNNDIVFTDREYILKMMGEYKKGVGVIGSKIVLNGSDIQPQMMGFLGLRDCLCRYVNRISETCGSCFDFPVNQGKSVQILHGCALLFTKDFFDKYKGFYPGTFLYMEEHILYLMCELKHLRQAYCQDTEIYHKEDQSSMLSFGNDISVKKFYFSKSEKHVLMWRLIVLLKNIWDRLGLRKR